MVYDAYTKYLLYTRCVARHTWAGANPQAVQSILLSEVNVRKMEFAMLLSNHTGRPAVLVNAQVLDRELTETGLLQMAILLAPPAPQFSSIPLV